MVIKKTKLFHYPTAEEFNIIHRDLKVDVQKLDENELLFAEWLQKHEQLPTKYNKELVRNFLRLCKNNLNKAKSKYENYVIAKTTMPELFQNRCMNADSINHKCLAVLPKLTRDCYKVLLVRVPKDDMISHDFNECFKFILLCADLAMVNVSEAGHICIVDCKGFAFSYVRQLSLAIIKRMVRLILKTYPSRLKEVHLLNVNVFVNTAITVTKTLLPEKLKHRIKVHHNVEDLLEYIPPDCIPADYGGTAVNSAEISENWKRYFVENGSWIKEQDKLQLVTEGKDI